MRYLEEDGPNVAMFNPAQPDKRIILTLELVPSGYDSVTVEAIVRNLNSPDSVYMLDGEFDPRPPAVFLYSIEGFYSPEIEQILLLLVPALVSVSKIYIYRYACCLKQASTDQSGISKIVLEDDSEDHAWSLYEYCSVNWPHIEVEIVEG
jgi:hypothetical protein